MSDNSNAAEFDVVSYVASGHLTDVKQVPFQEFCMKIWGFIHTKLT